MPLGEEDLLRVVRDEMSPTRDDEARVWSHLGSTVLPLGLDSSPMGVAPGGGASATSAATCSTGATAGANSAVGGAGGLAAALTKPVGLLSVVPASVKVTAAVLVVAGAASGGAALVDRSPAGPTSTRATSSAAPAVPAPTLRDRVTAVPIGTQGEGSGVARARAGFEQHTPGAPGAADAVETTRTPTPNIGSMRATPSRPADSASTDNMPLATELAKLAQARRAIADEEPGVALTILSTLERQPASDQLVEERRATRTLAICAAGDGEAARSAGRAFLLEYGSSIYANRVGEACDLKPVVAAE